jgi:hypothetical protein
MLFLSPSADAGGYDATKRRHDDSADRHSSEQDAPPRYGEFILCQSELDGKISKGAFKAQVLYQPPTSGAEMTMS